jgi:hypothetical protein
MAISVGSAPLTVTALGRIFVSGNSGSHVVKLVQSNGTDVQGGSVTVNMSGGTQGQFVFTNLASPVTLNANTGYYLVSAETQSGDQFYDYNTTVSATSAVAVTSAVYFNGSYVPVVSSRL